MLFNFSLVLISSTEILSTGLTLQIYLTILESEYQELPSRYLNMTVLFLANGCVVNGLMVFFPFVGGEFYYCWYFDVWGIANISI